MFDAGIKSVAHTIIGIGSAKLVVGCAIAFGASPAALPIVLTGLVSVGVGLIGNKIFDYIYDNKIRG
ncbi:MAG: hypothetical protein IKJ68_11695 [Clostridia bacterium]|nr:hypothetical protein [Clostridia bacterium]